MHPLHLLSFLDFEKHSAPHANHHMLYGTAHIFFIPCHPVAFLLSTLHFFPYTLPKNKIFYKVKNPEAATLQELIYSIHANAQTASTPTLLPSRLYCRHRNLTGSCLTARGLMNPEKSALFHNPNTAGGDFHPALKIYSFLRRILYPIAKNYTTLFFKGLQKWFFVIKASGFLISTYFSSHSHSL